MLGCILQGRTHSLCVLLLPFVVPVATQGFLGLSDSSVADIKTTTTLTKSTGEGKRPFGLQVAINYLGKPGLENGGRN